MILLKQLNLCKKFVKSRNFSQVASLMPTVWKLRKPTTLTFWQKIRQSNESNKEIKKSYLIWRKKILRNQFIQLFLYLCITNCSVEGRKFSLTKKIFCQINSLVKTLLSRNFCKKCVRLYRINFHTFVYYSQCGKSANSQSITKIYFVKSTLW